MCDALIRQNPAFSAERMDAHITREINRLEANGIVIPEHTKDRMREFARNPASRMVAIQAIAKAQQAKKNDEPPPTVRPHAELKRAQRAFKAKIAANEKMKADLYTCRLCVTDLRDAYRVDPSRRQHYPYCSSECYTVWDEYKG